MADALPRRNLPGSAEEWGRRMEQRTAATNSSLTQLTQKVNNDSRANASQLVLLSELNERSTRLTLPSADLVLNRTGAGTTNVLVATETFQITKPRKVLVRFTGLINGRISGTGTSSVAIDGQLAYVDSTGTNYVFPSGWISDLVTANTNATGTAVNIVQQRFELSSIVFLTPGKYTFGASIRVAVQGSSAPTFSLASIKSSEAITEYIISSPDNTITRSDIPIDDRI